MVFPKEFGGVDSVLNQIGQIENGITAGFIEDAGAGKTEVFEGSHLMVLFLVLKMPGFTVGALF
jgi:ABC-type branched-subunit amino acid transport system ATPase component